tara:strand:+ start:204 stop:542 length:339 start_codon:yes stop_codon:yes gene_type:complete
MKNIYKLILVISLITFSNKSISGMWNDKPVMCAEKQEVMYTIQEKKESLVFNAVSLTKVRSKEGLQKRIVTLPLQIYVNHDTKTYTILEYHDEHKVYCIISYGTDLALLQNL